MGDRTLTCAACLRPGAFPHLTRLPSSDFTDQSIPVEAVFGTRGKLLMERLGELESCRRALDTLADFLAEACTGRMQPANLPLDGCDRVEQLAAQTGLPRRTLHSRLTQEVGLSPKRVLRIQRLHRALTLAHDGSCAWSQVAARSGFSDQAHMTREFVDLLGESPTAWRQRSRLPICSRQ